MDFVGNQTRMDFLGNQTRMNFPGNRMGDGFSWESNGGCKKKNNNLIRLVPARIENGRGKTRAFFRDSLVWRPTSEKGLGNQTRMDFLGNQKRMNFPENRMGVDFLGDQTGVAKKIIITY